MNYILFEITSSDSRKTSFHYTFKKSHLIINDEFMFSQLKKYRIKSIISCYITLGVNNMGIMIKDYTLTNEIYI